jgi:aspartokinase/homoserine dehydrogenase 1
MITGYIASTLDGGATTLKRDGSDFSASIFGKLLKADNITIWTDVSGVYSADPRKVPEAQIISEVSYSEAIELAYFGAKVIHPKTMFPAISDKIPIFIRNTFEADHPGTRIYLPPAKGETAREMCVCGFTTMDNISLINVEGTGMRGVPGIASRLFSALKTINVSVLFIAQSSSENSICFALKDIYSAQAVKTLEETFFFELKEGSITGIKEIMGCSIIAAIGDGMSNVPGVSGIFFGALGTAKVNILSVAQGCDERNISAVVDTSQAAKALRAVHAAFWLSSLDLSVALIGTGRVGSAIIQMLINQVRIMEDRFGIKINIRAVANSKKMILSKDLTPDLKAKLRTFFSFLRSPTASRKGSDVENGGLSNTSSMSQIHLSRSLSSSSSSLNAMSSIKKSHSNVSLSDVQDMMACEDDEKMSATDMKVLLDHVVGGDNSNTVIIDATNSNSIAALHPTWLQRGAHVVTANKRGIANGLELYNEIMKSAGLQKRMYLSEVTIGASLPIRTTLHDILHSGDAVHQIVGLMSVSAGTVITEMTENGLSFTQAIEKTYSTGLFEDDVFEDLAGVEVAQKLLVLARELGAPMALDDIEIEPLAKRREVKNWASLGDTFKEEDAMWAKRVADAKSRGCCLRYVQRIQCVPPVELGNADDGIDSDVPTITACVRLEEVPEHSMYGLVKGPVYYFAFHTERYMQYPLVVQGPLSDSANTASGIVGDILRLAKSLGAKDKGPAAAIRRMSF